MWRTPPACESPRGFTLVELLAVIMIIALLMGLLTPAVMRALTSARNAAIKAEIDMLHMAIMNYKNEYGSFPPALDLLTTSGSSAGRHLSRVFPRCPSANVATQLAAPFGAAPFSGFPPQITGTNALVYWLYGYTDDPTSPLIPASGRKVLYDFDRSRISSSGAYAPSGKPNSPYLYITSSLYNSLPYNFVLTPGSPGAFRETYAGDTTPFTNVGPETNDFFNKETFQILCAGRDELFGTGDDLSNFWPSTRQDYLDNLKN